MDNFVLERGKNMKIPGIFSLPFGVERSSQGGRERSASLIVPAGHRQNNAVTIWALSISKRLGMGKSPDAGVGGRIPPLLSNPGREDRRGGAMTT